MATKEVASVRRYGTMGMVGGVLLLLYAIPDLIAPELFSGTGSVAVLYGVFMIVLLILLVAGLVGLHGWLREKTGRVERIGYYVSLAGFGVAIISDIHLYGVGGGDAPTFITLILGFFTFIIGSALIGIAGWRTGALPKRGAALFVLAPLGIPLVFVLAETTIGTPFVAITAPYGAAWAVVGNHLRSVQ